MERKFNTVIDVMEWKREELRKIKETTTDGNEIMRKLDELEKEYDVYFNEALERDTQRMLTDPQGMLQEIQDMNK